MNIRDTWSAKNYNETVPFVYAPENTAAILRLLNAQPGEKIWDFGCGSGEVTLELQRLVGENGVVIGADASQSMVHKSLENGVKMAIVADIQNLPQENLPHTMPFDAVFSSAALHWCKRDPGGVLESAKRVLKPGGRFVVEAGGFMNCIGIRSALHRALLKRGYNPVERDPWYFPSVEEYQTLLERHGFRVVHISLNPRITPMKGNLKDWVGLFCKENFLKGMQEQEASEILEEVNESCAVDFKDSSGRWSAMYSRLRVVAING